MVRVFVTGDTHGGAFKGRDLLKLSAEHFPIGEKLTRQDFVIILGDFGFLWSREETPCAIYWREWLQNKPWTTLFLDGNHDNHEMLAELPQVPMFGSTVGVAFGNVYHLKRGEVYDLAGKLFFTMGGATSVDKESRIENISWWREEIPNWAEFERGIANLEAYDNKVDFILGHTCPEGISRIYLDQKGLSGYGREVDPVCRFFDSLIQYVEFESFYFGHWHSDWDFGKYHMLYQRVLEVV